MVLRGVQGARREHNTFRDWLAGVPPGALARVDIITQRYYRSYNAVWILGPVALGLLACTVWVALDRDRLKKAWRAIHQINYVIFVTVYIHALWIGIDFRGSAAANALLVVFSVYVGVAALALLIRLRRYQLQAAGKKKAAAAARIRADEAPELAADRDTPSAWTRFRALTGVAPRWLDDI